MNEDQKADTENIDIATVLDVWNAFVWLQQKKATETIVNEPKNKE